MRPRLVLEVGPDRLQARIANRDAPAWSAELVFGTPEELVAAIAPLGAVVRHHRASRVIRVELSAAALQRRTLPELPPVPQPALAQLIARGAARYFRQNGHALVTAARWVEHGTPAVRVAQAVATDQELADAVLRGAEAAGLEVQDIVPASPDDRGLSLLPSTERERRARNGWRRVGRLALLVAGLWVVAGMGQAARLSVASRRVEAALARLEAPREALLRARRSLDSAAAMISALQEGAAERAIVADRLVHLARALPDSTVLVDLVIDQAGAVELSGRAAQALAVVRSLRQDSSLAPSRLLPETARDSALGVEWERFRIHLGPDGAP